MYVVSACVTVCIPVFPYAHVCYVFFDFLHVFIVCAFLSEYVNMAICEYVLSFGSLHLCVMCLCECGYMLAAQAHK